MKIKRLSIAGFGPYKTLQHVDFERFDDDGIFLIEGTTGAGKSSILDAICFALYAGVPRYDGSQQQLRSDYCAPEDPSYVELEFTAKDVDYRLRRSPEYERPKARGTGTTKQATAALLEVFQGGEWVGIAARPVDVGVLLDEVLGLSKDQFLQVILLAQNRFQRFLHAKVDERQALLRTLFGTRRFDAIETALVERRRVLETMLESSLNAVAQQAGLISTEAPEVPDAGWFAAALDAAVLEHSASLVAAGSADEAHGLADVAHRAAEAVLARQGRRAAAVAALAELAAGAAAIEAERAGLSGAGRAELVWAYVEGDRAAGKALETARLAEAAAIAGYAGFCSEVVPAEELSRQLGSLEAVLADEKALPVLRAEIAGLVAKADIDAEVFLGAELRTAALPGELEALALVRNGQELVAAGETAARQQVVRVTEARAASVLADGLGVEQATAAVAEVTASGVQLEAATTLDALLGRRLSGHAAELAGELVEGEPCAVCGSVSHPRPTQYVGEPVGEADVAAARAVLVGARAAFDAAGSLERGLSVRLAEQLALAGGKSVRELDVELGDAAALLAQAASARESAANLVLEQASLKAELDAGTATLDVLRAEREASATLLAAKQTEAAGLAQRVQAQLDGFDTVGERATRLAAWLAAAQLLETATAELARRVAGQRDAAEALRARVRLHGFTDAAAVVAARLSSLALAAGQARIKAHEGAVIAAEASLAAPELDGLAAEPISLTETAEALRLAREARDGAITAAGTLGERTSSLRAVVTRAGELLAASVTLRAEYAELRELANAVEGKAPNTKRMRLETYVLAAQLEEIILAANARLRTMTSGRYALEHDDSVQFRSTSSGLGIAILDGYTGRVRPANSLSGGETFLASLALALGLAEVVSNQAGGIRLDTLFIDEGFGSLDADTLAIAMSTLNGLRAGGRTIGLISHVEAMKEQIPARLHITVSPQGWSEIG